MVEDSVHFCKVLSTNRAGVWTYDHASGALSCSSEVFGMLGRSEGNLPDKPEAWLECVHPEDRGRVLDRMLTWEAADDVFHEAQFRIRGSSSQWLSVHCRGTVVTRDAAGKPLKTTGVILDISDWQANRRELGELVPVGIYTICHYVSDNSLHFLYLNDQYCKITGLDKSAVMTDARLAFARAHPEDRIRLDEANRESATSGKPFLFEGRFNIRGQYRWLRIDSRPTFRLNGDSEWNGVVVDITDLKSAEKALRESEELFRAVFEKAGNGIAIADLEGRVKQVNTAFCHMLGYSKEELVGRFASDLVHPDDKAANAQAFNRLRDGETSALELEHRYLRKDGQAVWVRKSASLLQNNGGPPEGVLALVTNITEHRRMERALLDADSRKDEFLATLAHELRNPLAPISNAVSLIKRLGDDDTAVKGQARLLISLVDRQVDHLIRLVDDLLEVSRITSGKIELKKKHVGLAAVIQQALETSDPLIQAGRHKISISLGDQPLIVGGDPVRLVQVFANLINNAAKYTPPEGHIEISIKRKGDKATTSIRDNGMGIKADMLPRVFDLFTQSSPALPHAKGGIGIGLALARSLVEMHGGQIDARSDGPEQGSEFVVCLPLAAAAIQDEQNVGETVGASATASQRALVVDDDRDVADTLVMLLQHFGVDVRVAYDGGAALAIVAGFKPHLALVDIGMPGMDGYEAARQIRKLPEGRDLRLVALSGWGRDEDRRLSADAGFDDHLVKPLRIRALEDLLNSLPVGA
jgi:PAS domain S-box-containing protein